MKKEVSMIEANTAAESGYGLPMRRVLQIPCSLQGSKQVCPHPNECDGLNRICNLWRNHSSK